MLWPIEEPLEIDESFSRLPQCDSPTNEIAVGLSHSGSRTDEISQMVDFAKTNKPSVLLTEGTMKNARLALKTARCQLLPRLSLYGGWSSSYFTYPVMEF